MIMVMSVIINLTRNRTWLGLCFRDFVWLDAREWLVWSKYVIHIRDEHPYFTCNSICLKCNKRCFEILKKIPSVLLTVMGWWCGCDGGDQTAGLIGPVAYPICSTGQMWVQCWPNVAVRVALTEMIRMMHCWSCSSKLKIPLRTTVMVNISAALYIKPQGTDLIRHLFLRCFAKWSDV